MVCGGIEVEPTNGTTKRSRQLDGLRLSLLVTGRADASHMLLSTSSVSSAFRNIPTNACGNICSK